MAMNLYDIVAYGDRLVIFADEGSRLIYTWNRNINNFLGWGEVDIRTLSDVPEDIDVVIEKVRVWHQERIK